ncbi:MAG: tetratricopeptide repeat protein [Muribaculaceae bacterium]|nr:tetratricopeptide repeat protein [Muribaculaceae bacterium]
MSVNLRKILIIAIAAHGLIASAQSSQQKGDYNSISIKAERFYDFHDWNSAVAMYELMLSQRPTCVDTYASACVATGMANDTIKQMSLMERSQMNAVAVDSLLTKVRVKAIALGEPDVYETFLYRVKRAQPWSSRMIDIRLLDFYKFRNDSKMVILTASRLLQRTPDNNKFIGDMANAYMELGEYSNSMECYKKILETDSVNLTALLAIGNYYESIKEYDVALPYLERAYSQNPTPYLKNLITKINVALEQ